MPHFCCPSGVPHRPSSNAFESPIFVAQAVSPIALSAIFLADFESPIFCCPRGISHCSRGNTFVVDFDSPIFVARAASPIARAAMRSLRTSSCVLCADAKKPPAFSPVLAHHSFHFRCQVLPLVCVGYHRGSRVPPLLHLSCISFEDAMNPLLFLQC